MSRPKVFISSTFYDLKHIRQSLETFVSTLGYDAVLFEKGDIAFDHLAAMDESCYKEVKTCDIFVLIIGGRYGSPRSADRPDAIGAVDRYVSITETEFDTAYDGDIPIYILVDRSVHGEYDTYRLNKDNPSTKYAHVESKNVFVLLERIYAKHRNNNVFKFDNAGEATDWLKLQWSGLFRDLLQSRNREKQLGDIKTQVGELELANKTLKAYLEELIRKNDPNGSAFIDDEQARSVTARNKYILTNSSGPFRNHMIDHHKVSYDDLMELILKPLDASEAIQIYGRLVAKNNGSNLLETHHLVQDGYNDLRKAFGREPIVFPAWSPEPAV